MIKAFIKHALYKSGLLHLLHHRRNRNVLTTVSFHRVLPTELIEQYGADLEWTVSDEFFRECMIFFKRHYNPVNLQQLQDSMEHGKPLPAHPLLVTFDDGWLDNLEFAMPMAHEYGVRPTLFVTTESIGKRMLSWQETLHSGYILNAVSDDVLVSLGELLQRPINISSLTDMQRLIKEIQHADENIRQAAATIIEKISHQIPISMLDVTQLNQLKEYFDLGTHGIFHEPLTISKEPHTELQQARFQLRDMTGNAMPLSMSYPHGRMNEELLRLTIEAGYTMMFCGAKYLTPLQKGKVKLFGRFNICQPMLQNEKGELRPGELATLLFTSPIQSWSPTATLSAVTGYVVASITSSRFATSAEYIPIVLFC